MQQKNCAYSFLDQTRSSMEQPTTSEQGTKMEVEPVVVVTNGKENLSKRAQLADAREHLKAAGCDFLDMDFEFRDNYTTLEREIMKEEEEKNQHKNELYEKLGLPKDCRAQIDNIIADNVPEAQPLRNVVSELLCCNMQAFKQNAERIEQLAREKDSFAEENNKLRQQMEQEKEAINVSNKRARPAPYSFGSSTAFTNRAPVKKESLSVAAAPTSSNTKTVYSFLDSGKPHVTKALNNEMINGLVNPRLTGYEKRNEYTTNSLSQYKMYQQFDMACNGASPY